MSSILNTGNEKFFSDDPEAKRDYRKVGLKGKDLYEISVDDTTDISGEVFTKQFSKRTQQIFENWNKQSFLDDFKELAKIESCISKNMFNILIFEPDNKISSCLSSILRNMGFTKLRCVESAEEVINQLKISNYSLILSTASIEDTKYRNPKVFLDEINKVINVDYNTEFCFVSGYGGNQYMNLKRAGFDLIPAIYKESSKSELEEALKSIMDGYYVLHLTGLLYGQEKVEAIKARKSKFTKSLSELETLAAKTNFSILFVDDNVMLLDMFRSTANDFGFTNILLAKSYEEAEAILKNQKVHLVLSDYRLPDQDGDKIHDFLRKEGKYLMHNPEFIMITGYCENELMHLKKKNMLILNKIMNGKSKMDVTETLEIVLKGFWVQNVRTIFGELI